MISYAQAILLGFLQGVSELFPISSLGHSVIIPRLLGWQLDQANDSFVSFIVLTHMATAVVLLVFFWRDWLKIVAGILRSLRQREIRLDDTYARLGWLLVVSTVPAGLLGILFEQRLKTLFAAAEVVAAVLVLNGAVLYLVELVRRRHLEAGSYDDRRIAALSWRQSVLIGCYQCLALIPGFSRTGLTMAGGMIAGDLSHENSVRYSFLLATPIIFAAALLKVPEIFAHGWPGVGPALVGALCSAMSAYLSVRFLLRYFETRTMRPFAIYCVVAGLSALAVLRMSP